MRPSQGSVCPLLHNKGSAASCAWCGRPLTGRQKKWCSRKCSRTYTANHRWTQARAAAKAEVAHYLCANAFAINNRTVYEGEEHTWWGPTGCLIFTTKPEVNHITPIKGKHGVWGCHHHQTNLEVLCRPCHLKVTAQQRKEGKL